MLRFHIAFWVVAILVLAIKDPIKGLGIIAGLAVILGIPVALSMRNHGDQSKE